MKTRLFTALLAVAAASFALAGGQASASPESSQSTAAVTSPALLALIGNDDVFATSDLTLLLNTAGANATQHYGPYPSDSTDSGTCGINDWANDTFDRHFTVRHNPDGTITVVEQFKNGSFVTNTTSSPGACDSTDGTPPGEIDSGITGTMHGYFIIPVPFSQSSSDSPYCDANLSTNADCTTATFVNTHFTGCTYPSAPCAVSTFFFHYAAGDQGLVEHEWKNASCDRGGNHGDIASRNVGIVPPSLNGLCL
jgi:hypothetical protein